MDSTERRIYDLNMKTTENLKRIGMLIEDIAKIDNKLNIIAAILSNKVDIKVNKKNDEVIVTYKIE